MPTKSKSLTNPPVPKPKDMAEIGHTGTLMFQGIIKEDEYNVELTGRHLLRTVDQMRKGDVTVKMSMDVLKVPLIRAHWFIEPASEDAEDVEISEFISHALFDGMTQTWPQFLKEALLHLDYGHYPFEIVYEYTQYKGKTLIGWRKFASRHPKTIRAWKDLDGNDGIVQEVIAGTVTTVFIPMEKLLVFTNQKEGDNWKGISVLRSSYKNWYMKEKMYLVEGVSIEKQGLGVPYFKETGAVSEKDRERMRKVMGNLRAHEKGYLEIPKNMEAGLMDMKGTTTKDIQPAIGHHDRQIAKNVFAQMIDIGASGSGGAYSASNDQMSLLNMATAAIAEQTREIVNRYGINRLVDINFPNRKNKDKYPELKVDKIGADQIAGLADSLNKLVQAGVLTADETLEKFTRSTFDLPDLPADTERKEINPTPPPAVPIVAPPADPTPPPATSPVVPPVKDPKMPDVIKASEMMDIFREEVKHLLYGEETK